MGVNRGILECHEQGIVTSASFMVTGASAEDAAALARERPWLAVGLHWDVVGEDERDFPLDDREAVEEELERQLGRFRELLDRDPTHVDSHRHVHLEEPTRSWFHELVAPLHVPIRGDGRISFVGGFYAQWEWGETDLRRVSVEALRRVLEEEVGHGWTELSCHPGYVTPDYEAMYLSEREAEVETLTSSEILDAIDDLGIKLVSFADYPVGGAA